MVATRKKPKVYMYEATLNNDVKEWIKSIEGCWAKKRLGTAGNRGMPDITGCVGPIRIEIEGKLPGNEPTKKQYAWLKIFAELGCITGWYDTFEKAQEIVIEQAKEHGYIIINEARRWKAINAKPKQRTHETNHVA